MEALNVNNPYKFPYTPMEKDADILTYYKDHKKTGKLGNIDSFFPVTVKHYTTQLLSQVDIHLRENENRKYISLYNDFLIKWKKDEECFKCVSKATVIENVKEVIVNLISLNPEYVTFELTDDSSIFFQSIIKNKTVYLELFFAENAEQVEVELITNIYQDRKTILAYGGTIDETFNKIKEKISEDHWNIEPTASFYGIPETYFTEETF